MNDRRKAEGIAAARREIARRISRFCGTLSPDEFEKLLDRMAHIHWKYDGGDLPDDLTDTKERPTS